MEARFIYITCQDRAEAWKIGRALVQQRLAACANILDHMTAIYWWEGKLVEDQEVVLILKTREEQIPKLTELVNALHSYSVPCVVALPILEGNEAYLDWIHKETT